MRRWLFRFLAILVGLLPFVLIELGLRLAGIGAAPEVADPFVEFSTVRPLFQLNEAGDRFVTSPARYPYFKSDSFSAKKSPKEFRVFCLGGSTVQGNPYSIETAFTKWLELSLQAADPSREWRVVNCGGISYASYRLAPILRECLQYQPDLFILYLGDNEFLESREYAPVQHVPYWVACVTNLAARSHLFQLARQAWLRRFGGGKSTAQTLSAEVDALLDYQGGLEQYHRDDEWRGAVANHFAFTLSSMLHDAKTANVPVLLMDPVSNIKDCPPFKIEIDHSLSAADRQQLEELLAAADKCQDRDQRIQLLEQARQLDARHAGIQFLLGQAFLESGRNDDAKAALLLAKDEDVCPLRMTESLRRLIYSSVRDTRTPIVPVLQEFEKRSPHEIPGDELLLDHVHPTISGHQIIAELLLTEMIQQGWVRPAPTWQQRQKQLFQEHLATLDAPYYARGQEHLEGLRRWTKGRVKKLRPSVTP